MICIRTYLDTRNALGRGRRKTKLTGVLGHLNGVVGPLLPALFESPVMGVALFDSRIRFRAVNETLAAMNGLPASGHIGKKLRYALGSFAPRIEEPIRQVLKSGKPISNIEFTVKLPNRMEVGHWVETYVPIRDVDNRVTQVAALVVERPGLRRLEGSLNHMIGTLLHVSAGLKSEVQFLATTGHSSDGGAGSLPRAIELIDNCIEYAKNIGGGSRRLFSVDAPCLQVDRIAANKTGTGAPGGGAEWRRKLSHREQEVLRLLADCKSNKDIAGEMDISVRTAETYRARVMMKLELPSIGHLVRFAIRNNIIKA